MSALENLGPLLREKRGSRGVREVAKEIGISHSTLSRVERGHLPDLENYQKLCQWLGIDLTATNTIPVAANDGATPKVHFKKEATVSPETAQALAQMILTAQAALLNENW